ncbi:hypothetical protein N0V82_000985 [Gnomoniopsis sp. IMI 355080]|nr:hypothetical protein N0V82_000985 [Gnomoniopsis sp. IMI 355080]
MSDPASKPTTATPATPATPDSDNAGPRRPSIASRISLKARSMSQNFEESNPPAGFMAAASQFASSAVVGDVTRRNSGTSGANGLGQQHTPTLSGQLKEKDEETGVQVTTDKGDTNAAVASTSTEVTAAAPTKGLSHDTTDDTEPYYNGYHFPPSYPKGEAFKHGLMSFLRYSITPVGFFVVLYGLNVVAWGGMLFLLLCNASPAMCYPTCNDINSPRRVWIEYDSQVLTALFSLTAFGPAPWRFRDLYYLLKYRLGHKEDALRRLAGIHRDWFRLPGSTALPVDVGPENVEAHVGQGEIPVSTVPDPVQKISDAPLTGERAPPTKVWKMDFVIWNMVWNTLFQCVLSGVMWGMNRITRPSWTTGLFVCLGCIVAAIGGLTMFFEGKRVKAVEGVPLTDRDRERLARDRQAGIPHYNNIKDKPASESKNKVKAKKDVEKGGINQ